MNYFRGIVVLALLGLTIIPIGTATAGPVTIDFESVNLGGGTYITVGPTLTFTNVGGLGTDVTISGGSGDLRIYDLFKFGGDPATTGQALIDWVWPIGSNPSGTRISFSNPVSNFSLKAGDFGSDDDGPLSLTAYDKDGNVLGTDSTSWPSSAFPPFATLNISSVGISKILYLSGGAYMNSTFIDDLTFTPSLVPLPSALLLLGAGLGGLAIHSRRKLTAKN